MFYGVYLGGCICFEEWCVCFVDTPMFLYGDLNHDTSTSLNESFTISFTNCTNQSMSILEALSHSFSDTTAFLACKTTHDPTPNINHHRHPSIHPLWAILFYWLCSSLRHCKAARVTAVSGRSQAPALAKGQNLEEKSSKTDNWSHKLCCKLNRPWYPYFSNTIDAQDPARYHSGLCSGL